MDQDDLACLAVQTQTAAEVKLGGMTWPVDDLAHGFDLAKGWRAVHLPADRFKNAPLQGDMEIDKFGLVKAYSCRLVGGWAGWLDCCQVGERGLTELGKQVFIFL